MKPLEISIQFTTWQLENIIKALTASGLAVAERNLLASKLDELESMIKFDPFAKLISAHGIPDPYSYKDRNDAYMVDGAVEVDSPLTAYANDGSYDNIRHSMQCFANWMNLNDCNCYIISGFAEHIDEYMPFMLMVIADEKSDYNGVSFYHSGDYFIWSASRNGKKHTHRIKNRFEVMDQINRILKIEVADV